MMESKCGETSVLGTFCVWGSWGVDKGWTPLPTRPQRYCDPASLVFVFFPLFFSAVSCCVQKSSRLRRCRGWPEVSTNTILFYRLFILFFSFLYPFFFPFFFFEDKEKERKENLLRFGEASLIHFFLTAGTGSWLRNSRATETDWDLRLRSAESDLRLRLKASFNRPLKRIWRVSSMASMSSMKSALILWEKFLSRSSALFCFCRDIRMIMKVDWTLQFYEPINELG